MNKLALDLPGGFSVPDPDNFEFTGENIGDILNALVPYVYGSFGFLFLLILVSGGFQLLTSAGDPKKVQAGQAKIVNALIGLLVLMATYWIVQILQVVFGINVLG